MGQYYKDTFFVAGRNEKRNRHSNSQYSISVKQDPVKVPLSVYVLIVNKFL